MNFFWTTLTKYREIIVYTIFGVMSTAVNYISYALLSRLFVWNSTFPPVAISWAVAVLFAYLTNRTWVFRSTVKGFLPIAKELSAFTGSRLASGAFDAVVMFAFVDILHMDDLIVKLASNVVVVILNYIMSKLIVFRKKGDA